jgi:hypothetical protein
MREVEAAKVSSRADADKIMEKVEPVSLLRLCICGVELSLNAGSSAG